MGWWRRPREASRAARASWATPRRPTPPRVCRVTSLGTLRCSTTLTTLLRARATRRATACSCRWLFPTPAPTSSFVVCRSTCCRCNSAASSVGLSCWRRPCSLAPSSSSSSPSRRPFAAASPAAALPPPSAAAAAPSPQPRPPTLGGRRRGRRRRRGGGRSGRAAAGCRARRQRGGAHADVLAQSCSGMGEAQISSEAARDSAVPHRDQLGDATVAAAAAAARAAPPRLGASVLRISGALHQGDCVEQYGAARSLGVSGAAAATLSPLCQPSPLPALAEGARVGLSVGGGGATVALVADASLGGAPPRARSLFGVRTWMDRHLLSDGGAARAPAGGQAAADVARANHDARAPFDHWFRRRRRRAVSAAHVSGGASAAVSPLISPLGSAPKEFGVPSTSSPLVAAAENAAAAIDDARGIAAARGRRRRHRRRPRQRDHPAADDAAARAGGAAHASHPPSRRRRAARRRRWRRRLLNGEFNPIISRTLPLEPASPPAPAILAGRHRLGLPRAPTFGDRVRVQRRRTRRRTASVRQRRLAAAAAAARDTRPVQLMMRAASPSDVPSPLTKCSSAVARRRRRRRWLRARSPAPTAAVQDARISHRIWLCGDATFVSPLNIDASDFLYTLGCPLRSPRAPPPPPPPSTPSCDAWIGSHLRWRPRLAEALALLDKANAEVREAHGTRRDASRA